MALAVAVRAFAADGAGVSEPEAPLRAVSSVRRLDAPTLAVSSSTGRDRPDGSRGSTVATSITAPLTRTDLPPTSLRTSTRARTS